VGPRSRFVNDELEGLRKEVIVAYFKELAHCLPRGTEGKCVS